MGDEMVITSDDVEEVQYSEVQKLKDQLALAEVCEGLEAARDAMHADRSEENIAAYKEWSNAVAEARVAFRTKYPPPVPAEGDGTAQVETIAAGVEVHKG